LGYYWEACSWCFRRQQQNIEQRRKELLHPDWLQDPGPKYWGLSEVDRQVWKTTRGIPAMADVEQNWMNQLREAEQAEIITAREMARVLGKWISMKNSLGGTQANSTP
jgi:hypothetical protein